MSTAVFGPALSASLLIILTLSAIARTLRYAPLGRRGRHSGRAR